MISVCIYNLTVVFILLQLFSCVFVLYTLCVGSTFTGIAFCVPLSLTKIDNLSNKTSALQSKHSTEARLRLRSKSLYVHK